MNLAHLYSGDDGESHFRDVEVPLVETPYGGCFKLPGVIAIQIRQVAPGYTSDFHVEPRRQLVVQLTGSGETNCGHGERRTFGQPDLLLADDRSGRGHTSAEVSGPRSQLVIQLDIEVNLDDWGAMTDRHENADSDEPTPVDGYRKIDK